jgi:hypothetical protein
MTREELLAEMERLVEAGDEKAYETFVLEHFKEFPEEVQQKILMGFFTETLDRQTPADDIAEIQKQGIDALEKLQAIKDSVGKSE